MTPISPRANTLLSFSKRKLYMAMLACSPLVMSQSAVAGPEGGRITGGSGQISAAQKQTLIEQYSDRIAIDWDAFDLDADEVVSFLQPGADSVALNRILSESASDIRGRINANGHVVLVNPRGIVFGESAQVNVGGLLASGLDIGVDNFMNGDFAFSALDGAEGAVINQGTLQASLGGSVGLLGKTVSNQGLIRAELGSVTLAAGKEAVMTFDSDGLMGIRVTESILQEELGVDPAVLNEGSIEAKGGRVLLTASASRDVFSQAVNTGSLSGARSVVMHGDGSFTLGEGADLVNTGEVRVGHSRHGGSAVLLGENVTQGGLIEANVENGNGGRVELNALSTTLLKRGSETRAQSSAGGQGGEVMALGRYVGAEATASVDASGAEGGGRIYLGGDYRGENPWLPNAEKTIVQAEAELKASATASGDGGRIIIWANESTRFGGHIEAAGSSNGLGGFAEVSGKRELAFFGTAGLSGERGPGTLLLDPENIIIDGSGNDAPDAQGEVSFDDAGETFSIQPQTIEMLLNNDVSVMLEATESISIDSAIIANENTPDTWLRLHSGGQVVVNKSITLGNGSFQAIAGHSTCGDAICQGVEGGRKIILSGESSISSSGNVELTATDAIELMEGTGISGTSITLESRNTINVGANLTSEAGTIQIHAGDSSLNVQDLNYDSEGDHVFSGDLTISGALNSNGSDILLDAAGSIQLFSETQTVGGDFNVGSYQAPESFYSLEYTDSNSDGHVAIGEITREGVIDTSSTLGGGKVIIETEGSDSASGDVRVGSLFFGYPYSTDSEGNEDPLHQKTGSVDITAAGDIYFSRVINFNDTGPRDSSGNLVEGYTGDEASLTASADGSIHFDADTTSQNATTENEWSSTAGDAVIFDLYGDARDALNITLTADANGDGEGSITTSGDIYTSGGNFIASGQTVNFGGAVITRYANALEDGEIEVNNEKRYGVADWSTGGNVELSVSEEVSLDTIVTIDSCINDGCEGNFNLSMDAEGSTAEEILVDQTSGSRLDIAGDFVFENLNENAVVNLDMRETGNRLHGGSAAHSAKITTTGDVSLFSTTDLVLTDFDAGGSLSAAVLGAINIDSDSDLTLGSVTTQQEGQNGSNITINSDGALSLEDGAEINASAGSRTDGGPGFNGGSIVVTAVDNIELGGNLISTGGAGNDTSTFGDGEHGGSGGKVEIRSETGSVTLSEINTSGGNGHSESHAWRANTANGGGGGEIIVAAANGITLTGDLRSSGGALSSNDAESNASHGDGGHIGLNGDVLVASSALVVRNDAGPLDVDGLAQDSDIEAGSFAITGSLGTENSDSTFILHTGKTTFGGAVGDSEAVNFAQLTINSYGDVHFGGNSAPVADRIQVNATGTGGQSLALTNTVNHWVLNDGVESGSSITFNEEQNPHFHFNGFSALIGGSETDHFTVSHSDAVYTITDNGGEGNSVSSYSEDAHLWTLTDDGLASSLTSRTGSSTSITFSGIQLLKGSGDDHFQGRNNATDWSYGTDSQWTLYEPNTSTNPLVTFDGMSKVIGGAGNDRFTLSVDAVYTGAIDGGEQAVGSASINSLTINGNPNLWYLDGRTESAVVERDATANLRLGRFSRIQRLEGAGEDQVQGRNEATDWVYGADSQWTLYEPDTTSNALISLTGMSKVTGGAGEDRFTLVENASFAGEIDGGSEAGNTLSVNGGTNHWYLDHSAADRAAVQEGGDTRVEAFLGIQTLEGAGADTFYGRDQGTDWELTAGTTLADNQWTLNEVEAEGLNNLTLSGMASLVGGSAEDSFTLTAGTAFYGTLDGGLTASNTLSLASDDNHWTVTHFGDNGTTGSVVDRINQFISFGTLSGSGGDVLAAPDVTNVWTLDGAGSGTLAPVADPGDAIQFDGMAALVGGVSADTFTASGDTLFEGVIDGGAGANDTLNLKGLTQAVTVGMLAPDNQASVWVARTGDDITIRNIETLTAAEAGNDVAGGTGNQLLGPVSGYYLWTLTGENAGTVQPTSGESQPNNSADRVLDFSGFAYLVGGEDSDFRFDGGDAVGGITGGSGDTWLDYSLAIGDLCVNLLAGSEACDGPLLDNIDGVIGNSSSGFNSQLRANGNEDYVWRIHNNGHSRADGINDGAFEYDGDDVEFIDFNQLVGGASVDTFLFESGGRLTGYVDGRAGSDIVDTRQSGAAVAFRLREQAPDGTSGSPLWLKGMETIRAHTDRENLLIGPDLQSDWIIDRANGGRLVAEGQTVSFTGIQTLWGGSNQDDFILVRNGGQTGSVTGGVNGGVGTDTLTIGSADGEAIDWTVYGYAAGSADRAGTFTGIEVLAGGQGDDRVTLTGAQAWVQSIAAGAGTNTLTYDVEPNDVNAATWALSGPNNGSVTLGEAEDGINFTAISALTGSGADTLQGTDNPSEWIISGAHEGTLETSVSGDEQRLDFAGMSTLSGGSGNNTLTASGANTWVLTDTGTGRLNEVLNFSGMDELVGDGENNSLQGPNRDNYWLLTGSDQGVVSAASGDAASPAVDGTATDFVGMTTLVGGQEGDQFVASATGALFSGLLNGGEPVGQADDRDSVDLSQRPSNERITVGMGDALDVDVSIVNIETLTANPDANSGNQGHILKGPQEGTYQWIITDINTGKVFPENNERTDTTLAFHDFAFLEGSENNVFAFEGGDLTGGVTGGSGSNFLDYSNSDEDICIALLGGVSGCDGMAMEGINGIIGNHTDNASPNSTLRVVGDGDYTWSVQKLDELASSDGINDGIFDIGGDNEIRFIDFNHLVGSDGNNRFEFVGSGEIIGSVDGGATRGNGRNVIDTTGSDYGFAFWQSTPSGSGETDTALRVQNIQTLSARNDRHNVLHGVDSEATWTVTGTDSGYLGNDSLRFEGVQHLKGGSARDTFVVNTGGLITGAIDGGGNDDTLEVTSEGDDSIHWRVSGKDQGSVEDRVASFTGLSDLLGGEGDDRFTLTSAAQVSGIDGGNGDNGLAYQLSDSETADQAAQWRLTGQYDGEIETANGRISGFENIHSLAGSGHDTLTGDNVATRWLISHSDGGSVGAESTVSQHYMAFEGMATLVGNTQADHFSILDSGNDFSGVLKGGANGNNRLSANQHKNAWALNGAGRGTLNESIVFEAIQTLVGGGEGNTLRGPNRDNRWLLTEARRGTVSEQGISGTSTEFVGMETLEGGARNDLFVAGSALTVGQLASFEQLRGGAQSEGGVDALDLTALSDNGPISVGLDGLNDVDIQVVGIEQIDAQGAGNRLYGASDAAYSWVVNALNAGQVSPTASGASDAGVTFTGFTELTGGTHSDTFALLGTGNVDGTIEGGDGDGIDLVDYSNQAGDVVVTVGDIDSDILGIEGVVGKSGTGASDTTSTLKVADGVTDSIAWTIQRLADLPNSDGVNDGEVAIDNHQPFYFIDFNVLEGGDGQDAFVLQNEGQLVGQINGRGEFNTVSTQEADLAHRFTVGDRENNETRLVNIDSLTASLDRNHQLVGTGEGNTWRIQERGAGELEGQLSFQGIDHLVGGSGTDNFIFSGDGLVSRIEGRGALADNVLNIENTAEPLLLSLDLNNQGADVRVSGVGSLVGNRDTNHRLQGEDRSNTWVIDGQDSGSLNGDIRFTGFVDLLGNSEADRFELHGIGAVSGAIDGAGGEDTLDLFELADDRKLKLAVESPSSEGVPTADLQVFNIDTLAAPTAAGHTLIGRADENLWVLDGENRGTLGDLSFTGVANLIGGNGTDVVEFLSGGSLNGYIDGRGGDNTVDMSEVDRLVAVTVGEARGDLRNITHFIGNNTETTLTSLHADNSWRLDRGENAGTLNTRLSFEGVTDLIGGEGVDTFHLDGGGVTGLIDGASGNDQFLMNLPTGVEGNQRLSGGAGNDELRVSGGDADYQVTYSPRTGGEEQLRYTAGNGNVFGVEFSQLAQVQDNVLANVLTINTRLNPDTVVANNNRVQVSDLAQLNYTNKTNLTLAANTDDVVDLAGALSVPGRLEIRNARVTQSADEALSARELRLVSVSEFGSVDSPIETGIETLMADVGTGGLALRNSEALVLKELRSLGRAQVTARGNLTSDAELSVAGVAHFASEQAGIYLDGGNRFSNTVHLDAAQDIELHHQRELLLGDVRAQTFALNNRGDVTQGDGAWTVDLLDLSVDGNLQAMNENNSIQGLRADRVGDLTLDSREALRLDGIDSDGQVRIGGRGLSVENRLSAESLNLDAQNGNLTINHSITANDIQLAGERVAQDAEVISGGALSINAKGAIEQNARLTAVADIQLDAGGELTMSRSARTETRSGHIEYAAGDNLTVSYLDNAEGTIALRSDRRIESALEAQTTGVIAQRIELAAIDGIGAGQTIALDTRELHATNNRGRIDLGNTGDVRIDRLANNDDIVFFNEGSVTLDNREGSVFDRSAEGAIEAGGVVNANYDVGTVRFTVAEGSLLGLGAINVNKPDLVGRRGLFVVSGDIGSVARPLVMYFKDSLVLQGIRSWQPVWGFGQIPETFENNSAIKFSNQELTSAGEQMVEVESLEDIDPAIFTAVRNYSFDEVSILMPPDQRYGNEDDDEERYSAY
ncbi:filamentous hemagglutinin N-terminal domain-containing protein [Marinimicrobium sp. LS-A18]|uniref:two-partner secretion domain-containing protein n=1 Tax=Marinimicrobium sp. LS-A18 TaxID=1381596 RepID=UPI000467B9A5|nr:filamentous hemagglutinin N-terminal domain-containing protein [Marinimicrobium sp. LS-A18]